MDEYILYFHHYIYIYRDRQTDRQDRQTERKKGVCMRHGQATIAVSLFLFCWGGARVSLFVFMLLLWLDTKEVLTPSPTSSMMSFAGGVEHFDLGGHFDRAGHFD